MDIGRVVQRVTKLPRPTPSSYRNPRPLPQCRFLSPHRTGKEEHDDELHSVQSPKGI